MIKDKVTTGLINIWGLEKFIKVIASCVIGAGITALIAESLIPNNPTNIEEKEND